MGELYVGAMSGQDWPDEVFAVLLDQEIRQIAYVPDAGHKRLIELCAAEPTMTMVPLTTEEEGVALLAGAWLGGQRGVLLMQSSGLGNCVNMFSLTRVCGLPLLMLVTMRGQQGEFNPWQLPMGENAADLLKLTGAEVLEAEAPEQVAEQVAEGARRAFGAEAAVGVLIAQKVVGVKSFER